MLIEKESMKLLFKAISQPTQAVTVRGKTRGLTLGK